MNELFPESFQRRDYTMVDPYDSGYLPPRIQPAIYAGDNLLVVIFGASREPITIFHWPGHIAADEVIAVWFGREWQESEKLSRYGMPGITDIHQGWARWIWQDGRIIGMLIAPLKWMGMKPITFWLPKGLPNG